MHVPFVLLSLVRQWEKGASDSCLSCCGTAASPLFQEPLVHSVLWTKGTVVGAVTALLAKVDIGTDAALKQRLGGPGVVAHTKEYLVGLILAEEAQGVHLHLCHIDWLVDEYPRGCLIAGRNGDGALVGDITCGVGVEVSYVQTHQ